MTWRRLALATALLSIASTTGCGIGSPKTIDPSPGQFVHYVAHGYVVGPDVSETLAIGDPDAREKAFAESARPIEDVFLVPADTFLWLLKQTAESRRPRSAGGG